MHIYSILTFRYIFCNVLYLLIPNEIYTVYDKYINCIDSSPASSTEKPPFRGLFLLFLYELNDVQYAMHTFQHVHEEKYFYPY